MFDDNLTNPGENLTSDQDNLENKNDNLDDKKNDEVLENKTDKKENKNIDDKKEKKDKELNNDKEDLDHDEEDDQNKINKKNIFKELRELKKEIKVLRSENNDKNLKIKLGIVDDFDFNLAKTGINYFIKQGKSEDEAIELFKQKAINNNKNNSVNIGTAIKNKVTPDVDEKQEKLEKLRKKGININMN